MKKVATLRILTFSFIVISFFSCFAPSIFAQDESLIEVKYETINPSDNLKYSFKRLREKTFLLLLSFSPERKANYYENT